MQVFDWREKNIMENYLLLMFAIMSFAFACDRQFNSKYGAEWTHRTRLPKKSFLRKIYPFKESEINPLLYVKLIPFFVTLIILITVLIVYIIYWIFPFLLSAFLQSKICFILGISYFLITFVYYIIIEIDL